ncbi:MAG: hypothetical protein U0Q11_00890 [Vicinamibacterales bacterium]
MFERRERRVLEVAVHGDRKQLVVIAETAQRFEGTQTNRVDRGMTRNGPEGVRVGDAVERAAGGDFARRSLGNLHQRLLIVDRINRLQAFGFADLLERFECDVAQHRGGLRPHVVVLVGAGNRRQRCRVHQLRDSRLANACVVVLARDGRNGFAFGERDFADEGEPNSGVRMLVAGLRAETIEQSHKSSPA